MAEQAGQVQRKVSLRIPEDLEATYSNFAVITHTPSEIIVDLACLLPNSPKGRVQARIIMTPMNAKLLSRALTENLKKFEAKFGEIEAPDKEFRTDEHSVGFSH